jgi:hypothetical protein
MAEFDDISRADQLAFWATIPLPIAALIDSGGKSIHALIAVQGIANCAEWQRRIEDDLYARYLVPLGVDPACRNEARLSRLPGHLRDGETWQRLLYLNPTPMSQPLIS